MTDAHVVVKAAGSQWAFPIADVAEVVASLTATRVPGMPGWLTGLAGWRGRMLAVADLGLLMGSDIRAMGPVLVLNRDGVELGLTCQEAVGTLELTSPVQPLPPTVPPSVGRLLAGQITHEGQVIAVVDVAACFRLRAELPARTPAVGGLQPEA